MAAAALAHACAWVLPHADAIERALTAYWVLATGAVVVTLSPLPFPDAFKDAVRLSAARGKLWSSRPASLGTISHLSVPQQWFVHFYALGAAVNAALLLVLLLGASEASEPWGEQAAVLSLLQVHLLRRLLETTCVMVYPRHACMHAIAYAFGMSYYAVVPLSLLQPLRGAVAAAAAGARGVGEALPTALAGGAAHAARRVLATASPVVATGAAVFFTGNLLQCWAHVALAQLSAAAQRRSRQRSRASGGASGSAPGSGGDGSDSYAIPRGAPFFVSCPHYLGEIVVYVGLAIMCRGRVHSLLMLAWVVVNLVLAAAATQRWYHEVFPRYPKRRKALVPWLW